VPESAGHSAPSVPPADAEASRSPRTEFGEGVGWMVFGVAVLAGALAMDRLEQQHINPYTVPGLLPALLGIAMVVLGGVLALRSWRRGAARVAAVATTPARREQWRRIWIVIGLCAGYAVGLIGHGVPFWLASAIYVGGSILALQRLSRDPCERRMSLRALVQAGAIGLGAALITQFVFQEQFLVRLP
jgi:hypothetical protein